MKIQVLIIPILLAFIFIFSAAKKVKVFDVFVDGVKEGFITVYNIAPYLLTMMFAIDMFKNSGAMELMIKFLRPLLSLIKMPEGVAPMFIVKPLSGSASLGVMTDIMKTYGADSIEGRIASVMMGSTETIFYTLTVYLGSCNIKKTRHSVISALIAHIAGALSAVYICRLIF